MVDINKMKGKIVEKGWNIDRLAKEIGMNRSTLYRKMNSNGTEFTIREADMIATVLGLTYDDINAIFFSHNFAYMRQQKMKA